jgi:hypothetical protein
MASRNGLRYMRKKIARSITSSEYEK